MELNQSKIDRNTISRIRTCHNKKMFTVKYNSKLSNCKQLHEGSSRESKQILKPFNFFVMQHLLVPRFLPMNVWLTRIKIINIEFHLLIKAISLFCLMSSTIIPRSTCYLKMSLSVLFMVWAPLPNWTPNISLNLD